MNANNHGRVPCCFGDNSKSFQEKRFWVAIWELWDGALQNWSFDQFLAFIVKSAMFHICKRRSRNYKSNTMLCSGLQDPSKCNWYMIKVSLPLFSQHPGSNQEWGERGEGSKKNYSLTLGKKGKWIEAAKTNFVMMLIETLWFFIWFEHICAVQQIHMYGNIKGNKIIPVKQIGHDRKYLRLRECSNLSAKTCSCWCA